MGFFQKPDEGWENGGTQLKSHRKLGKKTPWEKSLRFREKQGEGKTCTHSSIFYRTEERAPNPLMTEVFTCTLRRGFCAEKKK